MEVPGSNICHVNGYLVGLVLFLIFPKRILGMKIKKKHLKKLKQRQVKETSKMKRFVCGGYTVAYFVKALCCKPEGRGFDS
jgi:hypothetical protein